MPPPIDSVAVPDSAVSFVNVMKPQAIASAMFLCVALNLLHNSNQSGTNNNHYLTSILIPHCTATLSHRFKGSAVCPNQEAEYVCTTNTGLLIWTTETYIKRYSNHTDPNNYVVQLGIFTASLLNLTKDGHVTANLVTSATLDKNGTEIVCRDGFFMDKVTAILLVASKLKILHDSSVPSITSAVVAEAPQDVEQVSATYDTAVLHWTEPPSTGVDFHYHVVISPPPSPVDLCSMRQMDEYNVTNNTIMLAGLQHGVNYTVMVSAVNCAGESNFSTPLTVLLTAQGIFPLTDAWCTMPSSMYTCRCQ